MARVRESHGNDAERDANDADRRLPDGGGVGRHAAVGRRPARPSARISGGISRNATGPWPRPSGRETARDHRGAVDPLPKRSRSER